MVQIHTANQRNIIALQTYKLTDQVVLVTTAGHQNYESIINWPSARGEAR